jgi:hypothetical protein
MLPTEIGSAYKKLREEPRPAPLMSHVIIESPDDDAAGDVHKSNELDTHSQGLADHLSPNLATVPFPKSLPVTLTTVPPSTDPVVGWREVACPGGKIMNAFALFKTRFIPFQISKRYIPGADVGVLHSSIESLFTDPTVASPSPKRHCAT